MITSANLPQRAISVSGLGCRRGDVDVLSGISFELAPGQTLLVRGPNGAGKSTLLMCLAGFVRHTGDITFQGRDDDDRPGTDLHFISHLPGLKPGLSVRDNLAFWTDFNGGDPGLIEPALVSARLHHAAHSQTAILSAGQTHRLSLLRLLVARRPIWFLDEPTAALDAQGEAWVANMIDEHNAGGGLAIVATHHDLPLSRQAQMLQIGAVS